ncbi:OLC1v1021678C1 [Oldenlandia corymbosa var. corymbosa]|uniref:Aspergillus nuclease S1 n=1 Tax=Oldenlandia corymbosa var. corymbosa TaxID=529605 RepID=A0AAV1BW63_OLDCO|nr:OLC1v1021678C1 [Oldenlandia corymbosa var. corymbosa]
MITWIGRVLVLLVLIPRSYGWGREGHYATCKIAEGYLSEDAVAGVTKLLPLHAEGELAAVCSWADEIRIHHRWSGALHFADTPDFLCNYSYCRDCHDSAQLKDRCVTGGIYNYTKQLKLGPDSGITYNLTEALMFLAHFIGDVHQPLHAGFLGDLGGNGVTLQWYSQKTNLHRVWDDMIIESALKTYYNGNLMTMIRSIQENMLNDDFDDISSWDSCDATVCPDTYVLILLKSVDCRIMACYDNVYSLTSFLLFFYASMEVRYASESINLACKFAYRNATPGSTLGDDYFVSRLPIVEKRLAQGGVRLAAVLNRIFNSSLPIATE